MVRKARFAIASAALAAALATAASTAAVPNPDSTCAEGVKIEDPADGTYAVSLDGATGSITLAVDEETQTFSFTSKGALDSWVSVIVKGGSGALTYAFDPAVSAADDLHAPLNEASGSFYGLSHLCFVPGPDGGEEGEGGGAE